MPQRPVSLSLWTTCLATLIMGAAQLALIIVTAVYLVYFADHVRQLLSFAYPLDYGEGPLLAQVTALRAGVPIWRLYADPTAPPYLIVNYPPLYLLLTAALAPLTGASLTAGRLISLAAAFGSVAALARLTYRHAKFGERSHVHLLALLFLTVPIVREWAVLMRVDLLGICLGLWALVILTRTPQITPKRAASAGLLLAACLLTKPSLIAAPGAALLWLLWQTLRAPAATRRIPLRATLSLVATTGLTGGLAFGLLQWASNGWFALHVVAANANRWEAPLASGFWTQQFALRWPLLLAVVISITWAVWIRRGKRLLLPGLYTLLGAVTAAGVGKVGAYSNYFLELYAGLIWLAACGLISPAPRAFRHWLFFGNFLLHATFYTLLVASLLYYPPLWDKNQLRQAGLIEPSPPRLALGRYGLLDDATREAELLAAQTRIGTALTAEVQAAGSPLFTDMPGVAAAAGVTSRWQVFEARQLLDQALANEDDLRRDLANGSLPLAVIDYLGNWLTPEVVALIQHRYAQDGAVGTFDLYRPVDPGPLTPLAVPMGTLRLNGYRLAAPAGATYEPGELLTLTLGWQRGATQPTGTPTVTVRLATTDGTPVLTTERPLLYGAYPPARWPSDTTVQHMQTLLLPAELPHGGYTLAVGLRDAEHALEPQVIAPITVASQGGTTFAPPSFFVPARLHQAWAELGGIERAGLPLTPAVPFAWGRLQCFERVCLELRGELVQQRPLGAQLYRAETKRGAGCVTGTPNPDGFCPNFAAAPGQYANLGSALSGEVERNGWVVQWTTNARLERASGKGGLGLGRLGEESLRLPPGTPYRWP